MYSKNHTFALDQLPSGSDRDMKSERVSKRLPDGITSSMLYQDILRIALPATVELMLSSLVSMMDMIMSADWVHGRFPQSGLRPSQNLF